MKKISVIIPYKDEAKYIKDCVSTIPESAEIEILLVADGGEETVPQWVFEDQRISVILPEEGKGGVAACRNLGIQKARGEYVYFLDADDYVAPDRLEKQYLFMLEHTEIGVLGSNVRYFDAVSGKMLFDSHVSHSHRSIWDDFLSASCGIIHGSTLIRTSVFKKYEYNQKNVPAEDYELFSKMLKDGVKMYNLPMTLTFVRVHSNSVSNFLPYQTIQKTYSIAQQIWGIGYSKVEMRLKYLHLKYYRRFLFESHKLKKLYFISFSAILCPKKIL